MNRYRNRLNESTLRLFIPIVVACALVLSPRVSLAHAILVTSMPSANGTLNHGDSDIVLKFNSRVDGSHSVVKLSSADGTAAPLQLDKQDSPDTLKAHISGLHPGTYALEWQVLSVDGHITRGRIPFQVR